jgi:hypothetical protein
VVLEPFLLESKRFCHKMKPKRDDAMLENQTLTFLKRAALALHEDEGGVAMTEYIIVFSAITFGATLALISVAAYVKAYRDFLVWWMTHPAV